jgi:hypothetical protein
VIIKYGYNIRKYKCDGKKSWGILETEILKTNLFLGGWSSRSYAFYNDLINMGIIEHMTSIMTKEEWLYHHFLLQHGRLSQKECNLNRLLQIAYNIGQLASCIKNKEGTYIYTDEIMRYYALHNLDNMETYINLDMIKLDKLPDVIANIKNIINLINSKLKEIKNKN